MADIEIVKVGLKYHRHSHEEGCVQGSQACPYIAKGDRCFHILLDDALSVINEQQAEIERLKEQQPKVLSKEDVAKHDVVWMETNKDEIFPVLTNGATGDPKSERHYYIHLYGVDGYIVGFPVFLYNRTWRCWTNRPTNNVRMNTPWEGR